MNCWANESDGVLWIGWFMALDSSLEVVSREAENYENACWLEPVSPALRLITVEII